jgi:hypothetical protein
MTTSSVGESMRMGHVNSEKPLSFALCEAELEPVLIDAGRKRFGRLGIAIMLARSGRLPDAGPRTELVLHI